MSKKEAFCTNCGSLINIDDSKDKNTCLFCGTEVETNRALDLKSDPEKRIALQKDAETKAKEQAKTKKEALKQTKSTKPGPVAVPVIREIIVHKPLSTKERIIIFGSLFTVVAILAGIFVPTILSRNEKRESMTSQINNKMPFAIQSFSYKFNDNREFLVATAEEISDAKATETFTSYANLYRTVYTNSSTKTQDKLVVKVYAKNGLFVCKSANSTVSVKFVTSTPTPTPIPTKGLVSTSKA